MKRYKYLQYTASFLYFDKRMRDFEKEIDEVYNNATSPAQTIILNEQIRASSMPVEKAVEYILQQKARIFKHQELLKKRFNAVKNMLAKIPEDQHEAALNPNIGHTDYQKYSKLLIPITIEPAIKVEIESDLEKHLYLPVEEYDALIDQMEDELVFEGYFDIDDNYDQYILTTRKKS